MAVAAPRYEEWLNRETVVDLSQSLNDPPEFADVRADAFDRFLTLPLEPDPLYRKYGYFTGVDLTGIDPQARSNAPVPLPAPLKGAIRVVHDASGTHTDLPPELRDAGIELQSLSETWAAEPGAYREFLGDPEEPSDRLTALGTALLNRGYQLHVPDGYREPIRLQEITVLSRPHEALSVRRRIRAGTGVQLLATEELFATDSAIDHQRLYASRSDLDVRGDAKVAVLSVHAPDLQAVSVYQRNASVGPAGRLVWIWTGFGGFRTKSRNRSVLSGSGCTVDDLQSFYGAKDQSFDAYVNLTHSGTDTHGQSITRGVFTDDARGMSRGLVRIEPQARKTISYISEHAMLLSKGARSDTLPILEILCRDVKATHSTSVAPVDPEKVFYLESRGMPRSDAIRAIGEGFLSHVFDRAPIPELRDALYPLLEARWNGQAPTWTGDAQWTLPQLSVAGSATAPDWRFDAKLR
jgi:Fe-S cluster assembly scaffold protein SufB